MKRKTAQYVKIAVFLLFVVALCLAVWLWSRGGVGAGRAGLGRSFDFDLDQHMQVDPALLLYEETAGIELDALRVTALATGSDDRLYVGVADAILVLSASGDERARIPLDASPACIAVDADGTLFVGVGNDVVVLSSDGQQQVAWGLGSEDALPVSIVLRGDDVFVGDAQRGRVLRCSREGALIDSIQGLVLFSAPVLGMGVDEDGNLWVANPGERALRRYNAAGEMDVQWSRPGRSTEGFSGCCNPVDLAVLPTGNIVTSEKNIVRVKVLNPEGELVGIVAGPQAFDQDITDLDVAVDSRGRVLVLDPVRKSVRIFVKTKAGTHT